MGTFDNRAILCSFDFRLCTSVCRLIFLYVFILKSTNSWGSFVLSDEDEQEMGGKKRRWCWQCFFLFIFYIFVFISDVARRVTERVPAGDVKWAELAALAPLSLVHLLSVQPRAICALYSLCQEKQIREVPVAG